MTHRTETEKKPSVSPKPVSMLLQPTILFNPFTARINVHFKIQESILFSPVLLESSLGQHSCDS